MASRQEKYEQEDEQQQGRHGRAAAMSPQEAQQYRATAQQNSIDAIRAAEERYAKAKQSGSAALYDTKDAVLQGLGGRLFTRRPAAVCLHAVRRPFVYPPSGGRLFTRRPAAFAPNGCGETPNQFRLFSPEYSPHSEQNPIPSY
ncbi:hypothetical protein KSP40_PGU021539 [Platanthera guangdongensis]|uniref:Seed maturation protein n=1 Tax=Platanthera guangdongensis TaxID=2320717 RepID=A0ABR2M4W2_9ASPA